MILALERTSWGTARVLAAEEQEEVFCGLYWSKAMNFSLSRSKDETSRVISLVHHLNFWPFVLIEHLQNIQKKNLFTLKTSRIQLKQHSNFLFQHQQSIHSCHHSQFTGFDHYIRHRGLVVLRRLVSFILSTDDNKLSTKKCSWTKFRFCDIEYYWFCIVQYFQHWIVLQSSHSGILSTRRR